MFATYIAKLLHANRVTHIDYLGDIALWRVNRVMSRFPEGAMAIGNLIVYAGELTPSVLEHELVHVGQWRTFGSVGFAARYLFQFTREFVRLALRGDFRNILFNAYYNIPLEAEARDANPE